MTLTVSMVCSVLLQQISDNDNDECSSLVVCPSLANRPYHPILSYCSLLYSFNVTNSITSLSNFVIFSILDHICLQDRWERDQDQHQIWQHDDKTPRHKH